MELSGKCVLVIGLGITGRAIARFAAAHAARLRLTDIRTDLERSGLPAGAELLLGPENTAWLDGVDLIISSPGVPRTNPLLTAGCARMVPVLSELELAAQALGPVDVAITGTNGKSTVTTMVGEIFRGAGRAPFIGGNLGVPLIDAVEGHWQSTIVEVSSYQLEWIQRFRPRIGVYLNLTEDHLDRYRDLEEYGGFKARLFENQQAGDWAVLNRDDPAVWQLSDRLHANVVGFGLDQGRVPGLWPIDGGIRFELEGRSGSLRLNTRGLMGRHNLANAMAASAAALTAGIEPAVIEGVLAEFRGLPHRIQLIHESNGIRYVDDSKGTNVGAVVEALASVRPPVILIAGGLDKGGDYTPLRAPLQEWAKRVILIGQAREKMRAALDGCAPITIRETLAQAMECAREVARSGDTVLLSPACASFDQFKDYAERGRIFEKLARAL